MGPTIVEILHPNFIHNITLIRKEVSNSKIMAVVKANAYGHGGVELARTAERIGCEYLGVAFIEEAIELRQAGLKIPILVFGSHSPHLLMAAVQHDFEITLTSLDQLRALQEKLKLSGSNLSAHIKVDTGMGRVGFLEKDFGAAIRLILDSEFINLKGIYSHFSTADENDKTFARQQIQRFNQIREIYLSISDKPILFHMANSAAIMKFPESYFDMVRPGIMLYGNRPHPEFDLEWDLRQVMRFKTRIGLIKDFPQGSPVSYGRKFLTTRNSRIAVLPVGYADGYNRLLTNNSVVKIGGNVCPVVGTVCMDMTMVDIGNLSKSKEGDEVILFDTEKNSGLTVDDIARRSGTIAYETTCNISRRVKREHIY